MSYGHISNFIQLCYRWYVLNGVKNLNRSDMILVHVRKFRLLKQLFLNSTFCMAHVKGPLLQAKQ